MKKAICAVFALLFLVFAARYTTRRLRGGGGCQDRGAFATFRAPWPPFGATCKQGLDFAVK